MKEGWSTRWKALLIWLCGYLNIVAFVLAGGYTIVKSDNEELRQTTKKAFIVTLIFTLISMFFAIYNSIGNMVEGYYSTSAYNVYNVFVQLTAIAKIIVFAVFGAISFFGGKASPEASKESAPPQAGEEDKKDGDLKI